MQPRPRTPLLPPVLVMPNSPRSLSGTAAGTGERRGPTAARPGPARVGEAPAGMFGAAPPVFPSRHRARVGAGSRSGGEAPVGSFVPSAELRRRARCRGLFFTLLGTAVGSGSRRGRYRRCPGGAGGNGAEPAGTTGGGISEATAAVRPTRGAEGEEEEEEEDGEQQHRGCTGRERSGDLAPRWHRRRSGAPGTMIITRRNDDDQLAAAR